MMGEVTSATSDRAKSIKKLHTTSGRRKAGRFVVEGIQAVSTALEQKLIRELYVTQECLDREPMLAAFVTSHHRWWLCTSAALNSMAETNSPQGVIATCDTLLTPETPLLPDDRGFSVLMVETREPGNAGTAIRTADAAGAHAIGFSSSSVDVMNGKAVRASVGSLFNLPVHCDVPVQETIDQAKQRGVTVLATSGYGDVGLDDLQDSAATGCGLLCGKVLWLFGNEAAGLSPEIEQMADARVAIPLYGKAESLNLATAVAVTLYASARAQRQLNISGRT